MRKRRETEKGRAQKRLQNTALTAQCVRCLQQSGEPALRGTATPLAEAAPATADKSRAAAAVWGRGKQNSGCHRRQPQLSFTRVNRGSHKTCLPSTP